MKFYVDLYCERTLAHPAPQYTVGRVALEDDYLELKNFRIFFSCIGCCYCLILSMLLIECLTHSRGCVSMGARGAMAPTNF